MNSFGAQFYILLYIFTTYDAPKQKNIILPLLFYYNYEELSCNDYIFMIFIQHFMMKADEHLPPFSSP